MLATGLRLGFHFVKTLLQEKPKDPQGPTHLVADRAFQIPDSFYGEESVTLPDTEHMGPTARLFLEDPAFLFQQLRSADGDQRSFDDPADLAYSLAWNAEEFHEKLSDLEQGLGELHGLSIEDKAVVVETLMGLAAGYLQLSGSALSTPDETALVRGELGELGGEVFAILARWAAEDGEERIRNLAPLLEGYAALARGDVDEAAEHLKEVREEFPEAQQILNKLADDKTRMTNLAVLEAWKAYNREGQAADWNASTGALGLMQGLFESTDQPWYATWGEALNETYNPFYQAKPAGRKFVPDSAEIFHERHFEHWENEKSLVAEVERQLLAGEALTIREALEQIKAGDNQDWATAAGFYLDPASTAIEGEIRPYLVQLGDETPPSESLSRSLLSEAWDYHARHGFAESPLKIYALLQNLSDDPELLRNAADQQYEVEAALGGEATMAYSAQKLVHNLNPKFVGEAGVLFLAGGVGNLARLGALARLEAFGITGYKATAIAFGAEVLAEGSTLWAINTGRAAAFNNVEQVFKPDHLAKSYGADLLMIGGLKGFGRASRALSPRLAYGLGLVAQDGIQLSTKGRIFAAGLSHLSGMTGMVATSKVNQWLGLRQAPLGGWMESLVNDIFMYWEFALAHKVADTLTLGKMSKVQNRMHSEAAVTEARLHAKAFTDRLGFTEAAAARERWVNRLTKVELGHPGFSGGRFVRMIERGDLKAARDYLSDRKLDSTLGELVRPLPVQPNLFASKTFLDFASAFAAPLPLSIFGPHTLLGTIIHKSFAEQIITAKAANERNSIDALAYRLTGEDVVDMGEAWTEIKNWLETDDQAHILPLTFSLTQWMGRSLDREEAGSVFLPRLIEALSKQNKKVLVGELLERIQRPRTEDLRAGANAFSELMALEMVLENFAPENPQEIAEVLKTKVHSEDINEAIIASRELARLAPHLPETERYEILSNLLKRAVGAEEDLFNATLEGVAEAILALNPAERVRLLIQTRSGLRSDLLWETDGEVELMWHKALRSLSSQERLAFAETLLKDVPPEPWNKFNDSKHFEDRYAFFLAVLHLRGPGREAMIQRFIRRIRPNSQEGKEYLKSWLADVEEPYGYRGLVLPIRQGVGVALGRKGQAGAVARGDKRLPIPEANLNFLLDYLSSYHLLRFMEAIDFVRPDSQIPLEVFVNIYRRMEIPERQAYMDALIEKIRTKAEGWNAGLDLLTHLLPSLNGPERISYHRRLAELLGKIDTEVRETIQDYLDRIEYTPQEPEGTLNVRGGLIEARSEKGETRSLIPVDADYKGSGQMSPYTYVGREGHYLVFERPIPIVKESSRTSPAKERLKVKTRYPRVDYFREGEKALWTMARGGDGSRQAQKFVFNGFVLPVVLRGVKLVNLILAEFGPGGFSQWRYVGSEGDKMILEKIPPAEGESYFDQTFYEKSPEQLKVRAPFGKTHHFELGERLNFIPYRAGLSGKN